MKDIWFHWIEYSYRNSLKDIISSKIWYPNIYPIQTNYVMEVGLP